MRTSHQGRPCGCDECVQFGVADQPTRQVPAPGLGGARWIHGRELRTWLDAKAAFEAQARAAVGPRGRRERMERLVGGAA